MPVPTLKISILGGGPSGLYLALLVKRRNSNIQVTVYEQNKPEDTFGFGVVLADTGLSKLEEADAESAEAMRAAMHFSSQQTICLNGQSLDIKRPGHGGGAITRIHLLQLLQQRCHQLGVDLRFSTRIDLNDKELMAELEQADLVVGADGINSVLRQHFSNEFGTTERHLKNRFAWFGTRQLFANPALVFKTHEGGHFVAHYYRYSTTMSTFVAECDEATWFHCQLDKMTDEQRQSLIERIFVQELNGDQLVAGHSVWRQFPVIRNKNWSHGKYVLMGDALASAHFSIGSGTRIAMEDAIALANAIIAHPESTDTITRTYEQHRRPGKDRLIEASENSFNWYEDMANKMNADNHYAFVYDFMTRTGRIDEQRLAQQFPDLLALMQKQKLSVTT